MLDTQFDNFIIHCLLRALSVRKAAATNDQIPHEQRKPKAYMFEPAILTS